MRPFAGPVGGTSGVVIGALVAGVVGWSLPRSAISFGGTLIGFVLGCAGWRMLGLDEGHVIAGGLIGATFLGMVPLSFPKVGPTVVLSAEATILTAASIGAFALRFAASRSIIEEVALAYPVVAPATLLASIAAAIFLHAGSDDEATT